MNTLGCDFCENSGWPKRDGGKHLVVGHSASICSDCVKLAISADSHNADMAVYAAAPDLLERLEKSHGALRAVFIGKGSSGGSCACCSAIWKGEAEEHAAACQLALNSAAIAKARGLA